jgi:hypothetical protein
MLGIPLEVWLTMAAIVTGPVSALLIEKGLERRTEKKERKLKVFRELMAHRATRLSQQYVQALNATEVEFYGDARVIEQLRSFISHLNAPTDKVDAAWLEKTTDHLNSLLYAMAETLGYRFDPMTLKRSVYLPRGWGEVEGETQQLRKAAIEVFAGSKTLKMEISRPIKIEEASAAPPEIPRSTTDRDQRG